MNDNNDYGSKGYGCVTIAISLVAIVCSLAALSTVDMSKDLKASESITITILGTIVTLLVAWQIWITISSKDEVKKAAKAIDEIKILKAELDTHKNLFNQQNLEIRLLIDAHAKLQKGDDYEALSDKYLRYADALEMLVQSNVDFSYDKFDDAFYGLVNVLMELDTTDKPMVVWEFIDEEKQYDRKYESILTALVKREKDIDDFRKRLVEAKRLRVETIKSVKESEMGRKVDAEKKRWEAYRREKEEMFRKEAADRKGASTGEDEAKDNTANA